MGLRCEPKQTGPKGAETDNLLSRTCQGSLLSQSQLQVSGPLQAQASALS